MQTISGGVRFLHISIFPLSPAFLGACAFTQKENREGRRKERNFCSQYALLSFPRRGWRKGDVGYMCAHRFPLLPFFPIYPVSISPVGEAHCARKQRRTNLFPSLLRTHKTQARVSKKQSVVSSFTPPICRKKRPLVGTANNFFLKNLRESTFVLIFLLPPPPQQVSRCGKPEVRACESWCWKTLLFLLTVFTTSLSLIPSRRCELFHLPHSRRTAPEETNSKKTYR